MLFSFIGRFPDHRPKRIIGDWHATMFAASRIDEPAPAADVPQWDSLPAIGGTFTRPIQRRSLL